MGFSIQVPYIAYCIDYGVPRPMPSRSITDAFVRNVRPAADKQVTYIDTMERGLALVLVVSYGGTKTFRVMTYVHGRPQTRKLGTYPKLSAEC